MAVNGEKTPHEYLQGSMEAIDQAIGSLGRAKSALDEAKPLLQAVADHSNQGEADQGMALFNDGFGKVGEAQQQVSPARDTIESILGQISNMASGVKTVTDGDGNSPSRPPTTTSLRSSNSEKAPQSTTSAETASAVPLLGGGAVAETLGITLANLKNIADELPTIRYTSGHRQYPQAYIEAMADSSEWNDRPEFRGAKAGASRFADSDTGRELTAQAIADYESKIDDFLRNEGNAALSNEQIADILQISELTVSDWRNHDGGPLNVPQILNHHDKHSVPPHLVFGLYHWEKPDTQREHPVSELVVPEKRLLNSTEVAKDFLGRDREGAQRTLPHLHSIGSTVGIDRYSWHYVEALKSSGALEQNSSTPDAARQFSHTPEAARAIHQAEKDLTDRISSSTVDGQIISDDIAKIMGVGRGPVHKWRQWGHLPQLPRSDRTSHIPIPVDGFKAMLTGWRYPKEYPQNR